MARINSYTGEVQSEPTPIERTDSEFVIPIEEAVLDALGLTEGEAVILKGSVGGTTLTVEPVDRVDDRKE